MNKEISRWWEEVPGLPADEEDEDYEILRKRTMTEFIFPSFIRSLLNLTR